MQVVDTAAGDWATEIEAEVKRVRFQCGGEQALGEGELLEEISAFGAGDWVPIAAMVGSTILVRLTPSRPDV